MVYPHQYQTVLPDPYCFTEPAQRRSTHYAVGHQGSLDETSQDIGGMVLVVRHPGQAGVEGHHDERELGERAQQARAVPGETGLQVKLGEAKKNTKNRIYCRVEEEKLLKGAGGGHSPRGRAWCTWRRTHGRRRRTS